MADDFQSGSDHTAVQRWNRLNSTGAKPIARLRIFGVERIFKRVLALTVLFRCYRVRANSAHNSQLLKYSKGRPVARKVAFLTFMATSMDTVCGLNHGRDGWLVKNSRSENLRFTVGKLNSGIRLKLKDFMDMSSFTVLPGIPL